MVAEGEIAANLSRIQSLSEQERQAHVAAIERRVAQVQAVIAEQEKRLAGVSSIQITTEEELREAIATVEQLRAIFLGDRNEDYINELARHLQRIREDLGAWERSDLAPERVAVVLADQISHQVSSLGTAADFLVEDESMLEVAQWILVNTPFDKLYFYGDDNPLHVSFGSGHSGQVVRMVAGKSGRLIPRVTSREEFLALS